MFAKKCPLRNIFWFTPCYFLPLTKVRPIPSSRLTIPAIRNLGNMLAVCWCQNQHILVLRRIANIVQYLQPLAI